MSKTATTTIQPQADPVTDRRTTLVSDVDKFLEGAVPRSSIEKVVQALEQLGSGQVDPVRPDARHSEVVAVLSGSSVAFAAHNDPTSHGSLNPGEKYWAGLVTWLEGKGFRIVKAR